ncbi:MAG: deoxyguanosinetriphosphate triphosphohydrolase [Actinobacteria bacterium]|nr:deoxyguanosinetriphosphate triphosphohydrolase [Actinomycetota bacterium]
MGYEALTGALTPREIFERREAESLAENAMRSTDTRGREKPIEPCPLRTCYQRDRDRIIHSKAFRRLINKTQVFLAPEGDHYRTRLTHTLEVSQISRIIARALQLNEDLTEAIALGHDLGHTPFGHVGEEALSEIFKGLRAQGHQGVPEHFYHNEQSLRVVDVIEYTGKGLNLTWEVRDGILNHTGDSDPETLEGRVVKIADRIAYINHDIDDAIRANILDIKDIDRKLIDLFGRYPGVRINTMVCNLVDYSGGKDIISMSPDFMDAMLRLREFLFERVYQGSAAKSENEKAKNIVRSLFFLFLDSPELLPEEFRPAGKEQLPIKVCDYIAGMTDRYAIKMFEEYFVPKVWMV